MNDPTCDICGSQVRWIRHTQFDGSHYFCMRHAEECHDFGASDSMFDWEMKTFAVPISHRPSSSGKLKSL